MAGRKPKVDSVKKYKEPRIKRPKPYNIKPIESRGQAGKENALIKSFWKDYTMDQILVMTPEELDIAIDKSIEDFIQRQYKHNKRWDFPKFA